MNSGEPISILVVDDEVLLGLEMEMVLSEAGYRVIGPAKDIRESLDLIEREQIDAAILDVNLHKERSDVIADRLVDEGIPFIFLSGHSAANLPPAHRERPLVDKPFRDLDLLREIRALFAYAHRDCKV